MARAARSSRSTLSPVSPAGAFVATPRWMPSLEPTCALPAPSDWPATLRRLVVETVTRKGLTWDEWCRPWRKNPQPSREAAWCALRTAAALLTSSNRLIANDEAWTICVDTLRRRRTTAPHTTAATAA